MKPKQTVKLGVDLMMTAVMLLLMTYEMIGQGIHEWLGISIFVLLILHHWLNRHWHQSLAKGKYQPYRLVQTVLVLLILLMILGSLFSGILLSQTIFPQIYIDGFTNAARNIHILCAYWLLGLLGLHIGLHWSAFIQIVVRRFDCGAIHKIWALRGVAVCLALYGLSAFGRRNVGRYMLLQEHFVFLDFTEPLYRLLVDYLAIMCLWVFVGHYAAKFLLKQKPKID